jgi:hypothetical protein
MDDRNRPAPACLTDSAGKLQDRLRSAMHREAISPARCLAQLTGSPALSLRDAPDRVVEGDAQGLREAAEGQDGDVVLGPFEPTDVASAIRRRGRR